MTTDEIERIYREVFPCPQVIEYEGGWQINIEVMGEGLATYINTDMTKQDVNEDIYALLAMLGEEPGGFEYDEGGLH